MNNPETGLFKDAVLRLAVARMEDSFSSGLQKDTHFMFAMKEIEAEDVFGDMNRTDMCRATDQSLEFFNVAIEPLISEVETIYVDCGTTFPSTIQGGRDA